MSKNKICFKNISCLLRTGKKRDMINTIRKFVNLRKNVKFEAKNIMKTFVLRVGLHFIFSTKKFDTLN